MAEQQAMEAPQRAKRKKAGSMSCSECGRQGTKRELEKHECRDQEQYQVFAGLENVLQLKKQFELDPLAFLKAVRKSLDNTTLAEATTLVESLGPHFAQGQGVAGSAVEQMKKATVDILGQLALCGETKRELRVAALRRLVTVKELDLRSQSEEDVMRAAGYMQEAVNPFAQGAPEPKAKKRRVAKQKRNQVALAEEIRNGDSHKLYAAKLRTGEFGAAAWLKLLRNRGKLLAVYVELFAGTFPASQAIILNAMELAQEVSSHSGVLILDSVRPFGKTETSGWIWVTIESEDQQLREEVREEVRKEIVTLSGTNAWDVELAEYWPQTILVDTYLTSDAKLSKVCEKLREIQHVKSAATISDRAEHALIFYKALELKTVDTLFAKQIGQVLGHPVNNVAELRKTLGLKQLEADDGLEMKGIILQ